MKKRLRKKLHRGEFQEFGFQISWKFTPALVAPEDGQFFGALIEMVEAAGLSFGGGGSGEEGSGFICLAKRGSASDKDRAGVQDWFDELGPKVSVKIGSLEDAWHNPHPDFEVVKDWIERDAKIVVLPKAKA